MSTHRIAWRGALTVGTIQAPAQLVMVAESPAKVAFHHAHRCTRTKVTRLQQKRWCQTCRKELAKGDIVRVYEDTPPGHYLEITDEDLQRCEPEPNDSMAITHVTQEQVDPLFIESTGLLFPDGDAAAESFATIRAALGAMTAFGTMVQSKRTVHVAIASFNEALLVAILRPFDHVSELRARTMVTASVNNSNVKHVRQRLQRLRSFSYEKISDEYTQNVREMVRAKSEDKSKATLTAAVARSRSRSAR